MRPFNVGDCVSTPDGVGRVLYFTDYLRVDRDSDTEPTSAVVAFGKSATKYQFSMLERITQKEFMEARRAAQTNCLEPDSTEKIAEM